MKNQVSLTEISQFTLYFQGNSSVYGRHVPHKGKLEKGEKAKGNSFTEKKEVNQSNYQKHLEGVEGIGIVPIDSNNNVRFAVIDVDDYNVPFKVYQDIINELELPFVIFKSKSDGMHIYVFFTEDVKASKVVDMMKAWVALLGLPEKTEIFPKQKRLRKDGGNWINLPYFGDTRKALNNVCTEMGLQEALILIASKACNFSQLKDVYDSMPLNDGPPCLQSIYVRNDPLFAENYLFNIAIYYKSKSPNDWQELVHKANDRLYNPIPERRVDGQVISSHDKNTYSYKCTEEPLTSRCNKDICSAKQFGKEGDEISSLSYEKLVQVLSDPPHYIWSVNGSDMIFYSEQELRNQDKFADYCMRFLSIVPNRIKNARWNGILNKAFADVERVKMDVRDDMSPGAELADYFYEFLRERAMAKNKMQLYNMGRVYLCPEKKMIYFKKKDLIAFLKKENFRVFGPTEIQTRITRMGAGPDRIYISKKINAMRVWSISLDSTEKISEGSGEDSTEMDFSVYKEEQF